MSLEYQTPDALRERLAGMFTTTAVGHDRALKLDAICLRVRCTDGRQVRRAISELVVIDRMPIAGSSSVGYFRCETWIERLTQLRELWSRIKALLRRVKVFADTSERATSGQLEMDYTATPAEIDAARRRAERVLDLLEDEEGDDAE